MSRMYEFTVNGQRIQRSFGTDDPNTQQAIKGMIAELKNKGFGKYLDGILTKKMTLLQAYTNWSEGDKSKLTVEAALPFYDSAMEWVEKYEHIKESTRDGYKYNFKTLNAIKNNFSVDQVPDVLKVYKKKCYNANKPRAFNTTRNTVRSYLNDTFGPYHPTYLAVCQIKPLTEKPSEPRALSLQEVKAVLVKLRADIAAQFWTMCLTGAGMTEYAEGLEVEGHGIRIKGEKMARIDNRRNRLVPHVENPAPFALHEKQFRSHLHEASNDSIKIGDARKTFARWCLEAGVEPHRVRQYMGHRVVGMTERYAKSKVDQHLIDDAKLIREYITNGPKMTPEQPTVFVEGLGNLPFLPVFDDGL